MEELRCECPFPRPAIRRQVKKDGQNKGRHFYSCPLPDHGCGFFKWDTAENEVVEEVDPVIRKKRIREEEPEIEVHHTPKSTTITIRIEK